ncbi:hypothetical protein N7501_008421 [Penicillium viridicatum]|nr:hypothetical protein N7501_008421 [Penicillium viridicatum]
MAAENPKNTSVPVDLLIATRPNSAEAIPGLLEEVIKGVNSLATGTDEDRKDVLIKCRALARAIETPRETMVDHCWAQMGAIGAIGFGVDSGLWVLMAQNGDQPQKVTDLAASLGVVWCDMSVLWDSSLRLGKMSTSYKLYQGAESSSDWAWVYRTASTGAGTLEFHEFSRKRGWMNPTDPWDTSLMYAYDTDKNIFPWVRDLGYGDHLNDYLGGYNLGRPLWMDPSVYPVEERLIDGADSSPDAPFLVDIGGNVGHDLERFQTRYPNAPGKLILQDLPMMIDQIKDLDPAITRMGYDFHDEQPVKGARAYYIHSTLHNWSDDVCEIVLTRVKEAMKPGYSRLLLNENVMPNIGAHWETTGLDMMMLTLFSAEERTSAAWYGLIERAGLKIVKIWDGGKGVESVIECELV